MLSHFPPKEENIHCTLVRVILDHFQHCIFIVDNRSKLFETLVSFFFSKKKVNCGKPLIMSLDNVVNICPRIRLSREKPGFCCMQSLLVIKFSKRLDLDLL